MIRKKKYGKNEAYKAYPAPRVTGEFHILYAKPYEWTYSNKENGPNIFMSRIIVQVI